MLGGIGPMELIIILLIVILLFGGRKIPEIAKGLGKGIRDFKSSLSGQEEDKNLPKIDTRGDNKGDRPSANDKPLT
jgi:sec-independent protein translocase protein TatA